MTALLVGAVAGVIVVEARDDAAPPLHPREAAAIADAAPIRRAEFARGRACAHAALRALGRPTEVIARAPSRAPVWPPGVVGSITHCAGLAAAAVADRARLRGLGLDAEPNRPLPDGILATVASSTERAWLETAPRGDLAWDRLLFSAKESVFKAWHPLAQRWLGFEDAEVEVDVAAATFTATIAVPGPVRALRGAFASDAAHLATLAWID
ncbi:MAG: 4'-phosphopantetheinyl transferase superfamily protein [Myxococcales bacterium]|nr:4'-phosphopantetheinyl transferase superfamily protein [Myxococcales bacterium]